MKKLFSTARNRRLTGWKRERGVDGFTLIEIMLVVTIIVVLMGAAIALLTGNVEVAQEQRVLADIQSITTQLKLYETTNYFLPSTQQGIQALVQRPTSEPLPKRWRQLLKEVPVDPWGMPYEYRNPGRRNPSSFDLFSSGPDRKPDTEDDIGNWK